MENIFYNVVSVIIGFLLIAFGIISLVRKSFGKALPIICIIFSLLYIAAGIYGFFLPEEYAYLTILAMLAITIVLIITFMLTKPKKS